MCHSGQERGIFLGGISAIEVPGSRDWNDPPCDLCKRRGQFNTRPLQFSIEIFN